ncbi:MAG: hypothetical protein HKN94_16690 [Acidimicrobiales bacterium]|nr:hypothetical protein [Acidimicrobiales bacterium]RZV46445.1 MAG: hypothetical protein EX269_07240 [Acidimicrobiales bacterium]
MPAPAGTGYFISPAEGPGPGVLLLHSFWGLNRAVKDTANDLADAGFTVFAPDLADGLVFEDRDLAMTALADADMNVAASLVQRSVGVLRRASADRTAPIGVVGYGSGASWGLWLSARLIDEIAAVVTYYGSQTISMDTSNASYLCHWAEDDDIVGDHEVADLGLSLQMAKRPFRFEHYEGTTHGFAEPGRPSFDQAAKDLAWANTTTFLKQELR